jgi:hypothetical protein
MLRRPATAIGLSNEDILKFEEKRRAKTELQRAESNQQRVKAIGGSHAVTEKPKPRTVQDRIMGGGGR